MSLDVSVTHRQGAFTLEAAFSSTGGVTALFGRSGSGKTTLVNIIAGLVRPATARIALDGDTLLDTAQRIDVPVHRRRFGYVFQEARLFPHLSVRRNLLYGRWLAGLGGSGPEVDRIVDMLDIAPLLARRPAGLSGGEKQRVALGRALLSAPRLMLMDEPLAALDEARKQEILPYLERLRDETAIPIVYVSHSVAEVARLASRVVMIEAGRVAASGDPASVLSQPSPAIDRREAGTVLDGVAGERHAGLATVASGPLVFRVPDPSLDPGRAVRLHIAARDVMLAIREPEGLSALNIFAGRVADIRILGEEADVIVDCGGTMLTARITRLSRDLLALVPGLAVHAIVKSVALDR
ncbi:molybdenum ABC transporter ATP-binding protein [Ensifer soli]|uniref:molybdenum ABC transporter ATP-binding protein n=1 Tax=Ciceribacter sp. sgz301302 TaxID=3342379 RepID=UPI0035B73426